jgi:hypothetical protein
MVVVNSPLTLLVFVVVSLLLPLAVDLVTKRFASSALKSSALLALSLITGVLTDYLAALNANQPFSWATALYAAAVSFVLGVVSFFGLTSPLGISGKDGAIQRALPGGLGKSVPQV